MPASTHDSASASPILTRWARQRAADPTLQAQVDELLLSAAREGNAHIAKTVLHLGANPDARDLRGRGALSLCLLANARIDCFEALVQACDLNLFDDEGLTALDVAASLGIDFAAQRLIALTDPARCNPRTGCSALHHAAMAGQSKCAELLANACDPRGRDHQGCNGAELAGWHGHHGVADIIHARILAWDEADALALCSAPRAPTAMLPRL